jgi:hypothetical protein
MNETIVAPVLVCTTWHDESKNDESLDEQKGATVQATYFDPEKKVVCHGNTAAGTAVRVSGWDILTNAQVNVASILVASAAGAALGPYIFH